MRLFHLHNWLYRYERYPVRVNAFTTGPGVDWIDRKCYGCDKLEANKNYQVWLEYVALIKKQIEYERKEYAHTLIRNVGV
jgi:hypothetical protein